MDVFGAQTDHREGESNPRKERLNVGERRREKGTIKIVTYIYDMSSSLLFPSVFALHMIKFRLPSRHEAAIHN